jgi:transposase
MTTPKIAVTVERMDDLPVLVERMKQMQVEAIIDQIVPAHHLWAGISKGKLAVGWLAHILTSGDHRKVHVKEAMTKCHHTMSQLLEATLSANEFGDDRLGRLLNSLGQPEVPEEVDCALNHQAIRYYQLDTAGATLRLDSTSVSVYGAGDGSSSSVLQYGHSKDHRPDLKQFKVMMAELDPIGMPLVTQLIRGSAADDGLYVPAYEQACEAIGRNVLVIGDVKMSAVETRAHLHGHGSRYLTPLAKVGHWPEQLAQWIEEALEGKTVAVELHDNEGPLTAQVYERTRFQQADLAENSGKNSLKRRVEWEERVALVHSENVARTAEASLRRHLAEAKTKLESLTARRGRGRRCFRDEEALRKTCDAILQRDQVEGLVAVKIESWSTTKTVNAKRGRTAAGQPAEQRVIEDRRYEVAGVSVDESAVAARVKRLGWRAYATNCTAKELTAEQIIGAYHGEWRVEHVLRRLKGRTLSIAPVYVRDEKQIRGLLCLLAIALRVLTLVEYTVHRALKTEGQTLKGVSPVYPTQVTNHPSTELILSAFKPIELVIIQLAGEVIYQVIALTSMQQRLLQLMGLPITLYHDIAHNLSNSALSFSET